MFKTIKVREKDFEDKLRPILRRKGVPAGARIFSVARLVPEWVHITVWLNTKQTKR